MAVALVEDLRASLLMLMAAVGLVLLMACGNVALGVTGAQPVRRIVGRGILLAGTGVVLGILGALTATRLLQQLLYEVEPTDSATFVAVSVFLLLVTLAACLLPAWRVTRVNPVDVLGVD